jgi:hypothetical protein
LASNPHIAPPSAQQLRRRGLFRPKSKIGREAKPCPAPAADFSLEPNHLVQDTLKSSEIISLTLVTPSARSKLRYISS